LERESAWTSKSSTIGICQQILDAERHNVTSGSENTLNVAASNRSEIPRAKKATKQSFQEFTLQMWNSKVEKL
jgi:hypothetical protein